MTRLAAIALGALGALGALVACGGHAAPAPREHAPPGARLSTAAVPLAYDLRLEVDPDREDFAGEVVIRVRVAGDDRIWLHASGLETRATWRRDGIVHAAPIAAIAGELRAFDLGEVVTGEIELDIAYTGHTGKDQEGLFRQQDRGRWYLFSQSESVFARRFVPCFDEPRFKVPWRVSVTAPAELVVLGNAPQIAATPQSDGHIEHRFAETPPMPSYLLAIAVGPFAIVDAGSAGELPLRVIALAGDETRVGVVAAKAPEMIGALEAYLGSPLPWPKLDFVVVPHLFGAMENPGLVTFDRESLVGDADEPHFRSHFVHIAAHELAHMWFGNSVTPPWWDDLWLAEAFAQWMADKLAGQLHAFDDEPLERGLARSRALAADDAVDARALHHPIANGADAEGDFDAISYEKGSALLASFERIAGEPAFRRALRAYLHQHAGGSATTADLIAALARATTPEIAHALAVDVALAGPPVVTLTSDCLGARPELVATAMNGIAPMCFRTSDAGGCVLVAERKEIEVSSDACRLGAVANDGGRGYYGSIDERGARTPGEQLAHGDDIAGRLHRGEITAVVAAAELVRMSAGDVYAQLGALAIARALAPSAEPAAFEAWLGKRFAARLTFAQLLAPHGEAERSLRDALVDLAKLPPIDRASLDQLERDLAAHPQPALLIAIAARTGGLELFDRVVEASARAKGDDLLDLQEGLGMFGPELAPHAVELVARGELPIGVAIAYLARPATRAAAWPDVRDRLAQLLANSSPDQAKDLLSAIGNLCAARAEVAAAFEPRIANILDGRRTLDTALATIDRCIARRATAGTFSATPP